MGGVKCAVEDGQLSGTKIAHTFDAGMGPALAKRLQQGKGHQEIAEGAAPENENGFRGQR